MRTFKADNSERFKSLSAKGKVRSLKKDIKMLKYGLKKLKNGGTKESLRYIIFCFIRKLHYYKRINRN